MGLCNVGRVIYILTFYHIIANYYLEDVMSVVIALLGVFLHSALGGNAIQVTQIGKSTDRVRFILCGFYSLKLPHLGTDRTFGSDSVRYGDPVYFGRFGFGSDAVGSYRTYAESGARVWQKYQQFRCNNLLIFE